MTLVVGVVTFNNPEWQLRRLVKSFELASAELGAEQGAKLYFIDNGLKSHLQSISRSAVEIDGRGNIGFGAAENILMEKAFGQYGVDGFLCANPDGVFHYQTIQRLYQFAGQYPRSLVEAIQFPDEHPKVYDPITFETPWASACCLFIPRSIYESVGGFDENFFMYVEDVDYSWRARLKGFGVKICPSALFAHEEFTRRPSPTVRRWQHESCRYLGWKWGQPKFRHHWEELLITEGFYRSYRDLPLLPDPDMTISEEDARRVGIFDRLYSFAEARW
ncbi:MAG: hypothetical protein WBG50_00350 [Desulfomonilaceae bacterium]